MRTSDIISFHLFFTSSPLRFLEGYAKEIGGEMLWVKIMDLFLASYQAFSSPTLDRNTIC
jgi:hypothetical protein